MTAKRFMVDDAGTLIDMHTRDTFDYVSDVCDLLNEQHEENIELHIQNDFLKDENQHMKDLVNENKQLKIALKDKKNLISICEKKFKELGYIITCDDDGYVIE